MRGEHVLDHRVGELTRRAMAQLLEACARRHALIQAHDRAENAHELERIMATFSPAAEMIYNRQSFPESAGIRLAHGYIGFSDAAGAFTGIRNVIG